MSHSVLFSFPLPHFTSGGIQHYDGATLCRKFLTFVETVVSQRLQDLLAQQAENAGPLITCLLQIYILPPSLAPDLVSPLYQYCCPILVYWRMQHIDSDKVHGGQCMSPGLLLSALLLRRSTPTEQHHLALQFSTVLACQGRLLLRRAILTTATKLLEYGGLIVNFGCLAAVVFSGAWDSERSTAGGIAGKVSVASFYLLTLIYSFTQVTSGQVH